MKKAYRTARGAVSFWWPGIYILTMMCLTALVVIILSKTARYFV